jgi:hypothetical protein
MIAGQRARGKQALRGLEEPEEALVERCLTLSEQPRLVSSCTRYH